MNIHLNSKVDIDKDFFTLNSHFLSIKEFRDLKKEDKEASNIMWAIAHLVEERPINPLCNISYNERLEQILYFYPKFDIDKHEDLIQTYKKYTQSSVIKTFVREKESMELREHTISKSQKALNDQLVADPLLLSKREFKDAWLAIENMRKNSKSLWDNYLDIESKFKQEEEDLIIKGGGQLGLLEEGGLLRDV